MKQICFMIRCLQFGGAERVMTEIARYFCDCGYEVTILTMIKASTEYEIDPRIKRINLDIPEKGMEKLIVGRIRVRSYLKQHKIRLCISFDILANILLILSAPRGVVRIISERNAPGQTKLSAASKVLRFFTYRNCDRCVFQTEEARACYSHTIQKKGIIIPNPLKQNLPYIREETRQNQVIAIGRLVQQKNYDAMIAGFALFYRSHPEYTLKIYGEGCEKERLKALIGKMQMDNCIEICDVSNDVHRRILDADIYLMTSDYEGIPNSLLEAMAMGYAVIAFDCPAGGCRLLIDNDRNGILLSGQEAERIADALTQLAENPDLRKRLGRNAVKVREIYSIERIGGMWRELIAAGEGIH